MKITPYNTLISTVMYMALNHGCFRRHLIEKSFAKFMDLNATMGKNSHGMNLEQCELYSDKSIVNVSKCAKKRELRPVRPTKNH